MSVSARCSYGVHNGTHTLSVPTAVSSDGRSQYRATSAPPSVHVAGGPTGASVGYTAYFWVYVSESSGGNVTPLGGAWYARNSPLQLMASPALGMVFLGWSGAGSAPGANNYTGTTAQPGSFGVNGPVVEYATFGPAAPPAKTVTSIWEAPALWAALALVGLAVGAIVGLLVGRSRRKSATEPMGPSGGSPPPEAPSGDPNDSGTGGSA